MELSDSERDKIRLEERYRAEVRSKVEADSSSGGVKAFLNSSLGLWLLSAIFISGAGTLYQRWQKRVDEDNARFQRDLQEETARAEAVSRLDVEISYRFSLALMELASLEERINAQSRSESDSERRLQQARAAFAVLQSLNTKERATRDGLYPEFAGYTVATLLAELRRRLPEGERSDVEASLASLASLSSSMDWGPGSAAPPRLAAERLFARVILPRWQGTAFFHIDCNAKEPFC